MKALYYILPLAATALFSSCEDDKAVSAPSPFGPARGGMAAVIEGSEWKSPKNTTIVSAVDGNATISGTEMVGSTFSRQITLHIKGLEKEGAYRKSQVQASITVSNLHQSIDGDTQKTWKTTDRPESNVEVIISDFDKDARRISGTFSFTAVSESKSDPVRKVTSGAFTDVKF